MEHENIYRVRLFSLLQEEVGASILEIRATGPQTAASLIERAASDKSVIAKYVSIITVAVNTRFVSSDHQVQPSDEIAFITPVSGG